MRTERTPASSARVEFKVQFSHGPKGRRRAREASAQPHPTHVPGLAAPPSRVASTSSVPKITRLLVLGHHFERLVRDGAVKDYAEIARLTGLTRARVTQIVNLTLLAPKIQELILNLSRDPVSVTERALRGVAAQVDWQRQRVPWLGLKR